MVKPAKKPKGILCPACAVRLYTKITRQRADGSTVRVRECKCCGQRVRTYERPANGGNR